MSDSKNLPRKRSPSLALIIRPDIMYAVEKAFTRTGKIFMVDTETHKYIDGLVYEPDVLLTFTPPPTSAQILRRPMGFLPGPPTVINSDKPKASAADAKLYFSYPGGDYLSGPDPQTGITCLVLRVWHDAEVEKWRKIAQRVAKELAVVTKRGIQPKVMFSVTSTTLPNDPNAPHRMIFDPHPNNADYSVNAVSPFLLPIRRRISRYDDE